MDMRPDSAYRHIAAPALWQNTTQVPARANLIVHRRPWRGLLLSLATVHMELSHPSYIVSICAGPESMPLGMASVVGRYVGVRPRSSGKMGGHHETDRVRHQEAG